MDNFTLLGMGAVGVWMIVGVKLISDQLKLLKLYRKEFNPPYPLLPGETHAMFKNNPSESNISTILQWSGTVRRLKVMMSKYPENPEMDNLARRVRIEFFSLIPLAIGIVIAFWLLMSY